MLFLLCHRGVRLSGRDSGGGRYSRPTGVESEATPRGTIDGRNTAVTSCRPGSGDGSEAAGGGAAAGVGTIQACIRRPTSGRGSPETRNGLRTSGIDRSPTWRVRPPACDPKRPSSSGLPRPTASEDAGWVHHVVAREMRVPRQQSTETTRDPDAGREKNLDGPGGPVVARCGGSVEGTTSPVPGEGPGSGMIRNTGSSGPSRKSPPTQPSPTRGLRGRGFLT
jgi:hypothetical protein